MLKIEKKINTRKDTKFKEIMTVHFLKMIYYNYLFRFTSNLSTER